MPETVPFGTVFFWHETDKINPYFRFIESVFHHIVHYTALQYTSFHRSECIEWMCMSLIELIPYFDEYGDISFSGDDIDLSSLDRIVHFHYFITFSFEVFSSNLLAQVSCRTT